MRKFKFPLGMASATRPSHLNRDKTAAGVPLYLPSLESHRDQASTDPDRGLSLVTVEMEREDGDEDDDFY